MTQDVQDIELIEMISKGDKVAFSQFLDRNLAAILTYIKRYIPEHSNAEDISQEVFTRIWLHAEKWKNEGKSPKSWVYRIAYNLCMDELRRRKTTLDNIDTLVSKSSVEDDWQNDTEQQALQNAIKQLPERQRTALWLCVYQGLSNKQTASTMDISVDALESLLSRARRSLRKQLGR